jgi:hypothetical protein
MKASHLTEINADNGQKLHYFIFQEQDRDWRSFFPAGRNPNEGAARAMKKLAVTLALTILSASVRAQGLGHDEAQAVEPMASVMQSFGILGTWAFRGCGASAAWTNKFYVSGDKVMQTLTWGSTYSGAPMKGGLTSAISNAKISGDTLVIRKQENDIGYEDRSEKLKYYGVPYAEMDEIYVKQGQRIRLWSRSRVATQQGGMLFVKEGVEQRRGNPEPWYERCN